MSIKTTGGGKDAVTSPVGSPDLDGPHVGVKTRKLMRDSVVKLPLVPNANSLMERKNPTKAIRCLERMAEGQSFKKIMREEETDFRTLSSLRGRHVRALEQRRAEVAEGALQISEASRMLLHEKLASLASDPNALDKTSLKDLVVTYGVATDKHFVALGETQRHVVEHRVDATSLEDAAKAIAEAKERVRAKSAIDVTATAVVEGVVVP